MKHQIGDNPAYSQSTSRCRLHREVAGFLHCVSDDLTTCKLPCEGKKSFKINLRMLFCFKGAVGFVLLFCFKDSRQTSDSIFITGFIVPNRLKK